MNYTFIRARSGDEELVIISAKLFDRIVRLIKRPARKQTLAEWVNSSSNADTLPIALAERLSAGEMPHRLFRELRGLSTTDLAEVTGLPLDYLEELEAGRTEETLAVRRKIAGALNVRLDDLEPADHT